MRQIGLAWEKFGDRSHMNSEGPRFVCWTWWITPWDSDGQLLELLRHQFPKGTQGNVVMRDVPVIFPKVFFVSLGNFALTVDIVPSYPEIPLDQFLVKHRERFSVTKHAIVKVVDLQNHFNE